MSDLFNRLKKVHEKDEDDMSRFEVAYTPAGKSDDFREFEEFSTKKQAEKFARDMVAKGATKVFVDQYDRDGDLINYKGIA